MKLTAKQQAALAKWNIALCAVESAKKTIEEEKRIRKETFAVFGFLADERQQTFELSEGWALRYKTPYKREIDLAVLASLHAPLQALRVSLDSLVEWKPVLKLREYHELTAEARQVFDACLTTTPGLPTMELVPPKKKG